MVGLAAVVVAGAGAASPAYAVTDVNEIVDACGTQSVCLFDGASISNADELAGSLPEGVRVVVVGDPAIKAEVEAAIAPSEAEFKFVETK